MALNRYCDGVVRRDFLKAGVLSGLGLSLGSYFRAAAAGEVKEAKGKSAIFVYLGGGPTHMDTFDLKPDAPADFRGEFKPIKTNVPGMEICEHMPKLAQCADKFAILRGVSHTLAAHEFGTKYMITGNRPLPSLEYPGYGAVVSKERPGPSDLPPFVAIPDTPQTPGFLGVAHAPFSVGNVPAAGRPGQGGRRPGFNVRGISLANGLTISDIERRQDLLNDLDKTFEAVDTRSDLLNGLDRFSDQAFDILRSKRAREAFDISRESPGTAARFGDHAFGVSCLLATRIIEAGVRFATVSFGGWDTHRGNFDTLKNGKLAQLDDGLSGLFNTLADKGLLESTAIFVTGEFGRTPKVNQNAGRDHWARAMFVLLAGGGMKGGQVIGASNDKGQEPASRVIAPDDVAASFYHSLGIDVTKEYHSNTGRPVMIVRNGTAIKELFS
jgi:uncharacterized protein (DUF1501 family)